MYKYRLITLTLGLVFSLTLGASAVRADAVHADKFIGELIAAEFSISVEHFNLDLPSASRAAESDKFFGAAEANGGTLTFSVPTLECAPGFFKGGQAEVSPNPEPATMILLGTGLVATAAIFRRRRKV